MTQDVPADDDLPCTQVVMLITDYLDDALAPADRDRIDEHLADCDGCTVVLDQFRTTVRTTGMLQTEDLDRLDPGTRDDLLGVFRRWAAERPGA
ncbi:zf-HC2 domain-containing protein [Kineosporia sp. A_224]|uniref:zf-HC2 domain-containing protein n=1 Tax=Kineosporia sp. A_224 TaxID=1962180 RepID=UPI0018E932DD|nr:zf-HC2 domain-containing protein [Kineosporia sp. A_224]